MNSLCSNDTTGLKDILCCDVSLRSPMALIYAKNGMAKKAMLKNMKEGNIDKLKKQIKKGTVLIHYK